MAGSVQSEKTEQVLEKVFISKADQNLFAQGNHYDIYKKLGAHPSKENDIKGIFFAVWAPSAVYVHVIGDFNHWNETTHPMEKIGQSGIWKLFIPGLEAGTAYKYLITTQDGRKLQKADPFGNQAQIRPGTSSIVADMEGFRWTDSGWMAARDQKDVQRQPLAVYECHIGSFKKNGIGDGFYNYRQFADEIVGYLKGMKYTHVELMGIAEYPYDGSWGYQVTGYYAPTARYGSPKDFMYLVNTLHKNNIGVILDWVPAHFAIDEHGLAEFDGTCVFEYSNPERGEHPHWGTRIFDYGKPQVRNFLLANVMYWLREYHIDGIRVDAVASMLYLDYGKDSGDWQPNTYGGQENLEVVSFFRKMNTVVKEEYPGVMTIAEDSSTWSQVTGEPGTESLGFSFKWNMGWMHDFCNYLRLKPPQRKYNHHALTFAMAYNKNEKYLLPISHDEVVHLKGSMAGKIPGIPKDKYGCLRAGYAYMFGHAGKKLLFMGQDFGQEREWSEARELDWFLLEEKNNFGLHRFVGALLEIYGKYPCMYELDDSWAGFEWLNADDEGRSTYSFVRKSISGRNSLLFVINMTPKKWKNYTVGVPKNKKYKLILNSDDLEYAGEGNKIPSEITPLKKSCNGRMYSIFFDLPPYGAVVFVF